MGFPSRHAARFCFYYFPPSGGIAWSVVLLFLTGGLPRNIPVGRVRVLSTYRTETAHIRRFLAVFEVLVDGR